MTLAEYLDQPGHTASALAATTGSAVSTITRAAKGDLMPSRDLMRLIFNATDGAAILPDVAGARSAAEVGCDSLLRATMRLIRRRADEMGCDVVTAGLRLQGYVA